MDISDLQKLVRRRTSMREAGIALLIASGILAVFLIVPSMHKTQPADTAPVAVATSTPNAYANVQVNAKAAIVYDLATHKVLYAKHPYAQLPLASLTKLLTTYSAISTFPIDHVITIPQNVMGLSEPHAFSPGQQFTLGNLLRLTLTASLNDGAQAIAEATAAARKESLPVSQMAAASALGLSQTYALNGNGLRVSKYLSGGYGSPYDIALLAGAVQAKIPNVVSATTHLTAQETDASGTPFTVKNTDPMVEVYPHLLLSKTGYTDLAGGNLALVFDVGIDHRIAVVVLGSTIKSRFTDAAALVDATLAHFAGVATL